MYNTYRELLGHNSLSSNDKQFIQSAYRETFGREMRLKSTKCRDCYNDALIELINHFAPNEREVIFNGVKIKIKTK